MWGKGVRKGREGGGKYKKKTDMEPYHFVEHLGF